MPHSDIRHKLSEYLDGSISAREKAEIDEHLRTCVVCNDALRDLRKTVEHIKTIEEVDPPAWMSQKIMATVRAEAGEHKGFFQRFFFPLRVKLPIQAVAVLFLAVTAFYVNQTIQTAPERSEAPLQEFAAQNEASSIGTARDKLAEGDVPAVHSKKVGQSPEYKALDMKLAYEKPAAPIPQDRPAAPTPTPAKAAEESALLKDEASMEQPSVATQAGAPAETRELIAPAAGKPHRERIENSGAPKFKSGLSAADRSTSKSGAKIMDGPFQLAINQTITFESDNVSLKLLKVTEDSRCPLGVRCTWEGQVTVLIRVMKHDRNIGDISLTCRAGDHDELAIKLVDGYLLKLINVDPYPKQGDTVKSPDYRATLVISKI